MKKFLIIGNINAACTTEVFPFIKRGKIWLGTSKQGMGFLTNGEVGYVSNTCWLTNLDNLKYKKPLKLTKKYSPEIYKKYDNFDAVEVSKTKDIPMDYSGVMGVPVTFLFKYHPEQFEIIGCVHKNLKNPDADKGLLLGEPVFVEGKKTPEQQCYLNGKPKFLRIIIKRKKNVYKN